MSRSLRIPALSIILAALGGLLLSAAGLDFPFARPDEWKQVAWPGVYLPVLPHFEPSPVPTLTATPSPGRVLISEVLADPTTGEPDGEWIELYNPGDNAVPLEGYKLGDAWEAHDAEGMLAFPKGVRLAPGQVLVVANQAAVFQAAYAFKPDYEMRDTDPQVPDLKKYSAWGDRSVELTNGGDEVLLLGPEDLAADTLSWGSSLKAFSPPVKRANQGHSYERYPPSLDTDTAQDWRDCGLPTPGRVDLTPPTATPSPTPTLTLTPTPTTTPMPTATPTQTRTATRGPVPVPSQTPTGTLTLTPTSTEGPVRRLLLVSEVLYDPEGDEPEGEWIEIYNADTFSADLDDYKVGDEETRAGSEGMLQFPGGAVIAAGEAVVIANRASTFYLRYGFTPDYEMVETDAGVPNMIRYRSWAGGTVNLANASPHDEVLLLDAFDTLVDALSWGSSTWAFSPSVPDLPQGCSAERYPGNQDSDSAGDWRRQCNPDPGQVDLTALQTTLTPSPSGSPTLTRSLSPTRTPTLTRSPSSTRTPTLTRSPSPTRTPTFTRTPSPTRTPTFTKSPSPTVVPSPTAAGVRLVLNEILADPPSQGGDANGDGIYDAWEDEFVELVNRSGTAIDLSGWRLQDASGTGHVFPAGSLLQDGCAAVIFGGGAPVGAFGGSLVQVASEGRLALRNFGDEVTLHDRDGVLVFVYTYGAEGDEDQSLTRSPDITGPEPLVLHSRAEGSGGTLFSPGTGVDGQVFGWGGKRNTTATRFRMMWSTVLRRVAVVARNH